MNDSYSSYCSYYKTIAVKIMWDFHKNRLINQKIRIENPEINPSIYAQLIFFKRVLRPFVFVSHCCCNKLAQTE